MLTYKKAEKLARTWVDLVTDGTDAIQPELTMSRPYGWIFFYQSKDCLDNPNDPSRMLFGNAPIIIDRMTGELTVTGTGKPIKEYLADYEATLPSSRL
jgi:hypothetical protein